MLVALASALLMLGAVHQIHWLEGAPNEVVRIDPVRMAHGILTGVGFLCGGVIFQQGVSVHGLTTAASLWITSAIGTLFGVGLYELAVGGAVLSLVVLSAARWLDRHMPQKNFAEITVRSRREALIDGPELLRLLEGFDLEGAGSARRWRRAGRCSSCRGRSPAGACCGSTPCRPPCAPILACWSSTSSRARTENRDSPDFSHGLPPL